MIGNLLHLLPGLLLQVALATALLWLFIRPSDEVPVLHILLTALGFTFLNMAIEWTLRDYLLETTVVVQWTLFVLLANHFLSIPLPRAALTLFCFFALMLGVGLLDARRSPSALSEEEQLLIEGFQAVKLSESAESEDLSPWSIQLRNGILDKRLLAARAVARRSLYTVSEKERVVKPDPTPDPMPEPIPEPIPETAPEPPVISQTPAITGKEFEALFDRHAPSDPPTTIQELPGITDLPSQGSVELEASVDDPDTRPDRRHHPGGFNAAQLSEAVDVRNRSTDRRYANPQFEVGAVSIGEHGRFAIVDGEMLKEGSVVRTNREDPRGWKLHRVEPTELLWQPLK